jgi:glycosyltransferase involved in cell wall biosynthesis
MPPKILIVADWYLPGYKAGGQITAVANLVESIGQEFELFVLTRDRDLTDQRPYSGIHRDEWQTVGGAKVLYTSNLSFRHVRKRIFEVRPDVVYLNSFFSSLVIKTLCLRKLGLLPACSVVLAPRGEFSPGALKIKHWRKSLFGNGALRAGLYRGLIWHASSELERDNIAALLQAAHEDRPCIHVAWDLPSRDWIEGTKGVSKQAKGAVTRFVFISRISLKKNLLFAIDALAGLTGHVEFDIFGPIVDPGCWKDCQQRIERLPDNLGVRYCGTVPHGSVPDVAGGYHFFLLPTQGENFGYVILEAMAAGCPVILSDRTPWRDLTKQGIGWDLPLDDPELWRKVLQQCVDMDQQTYAPFSDRAREFVKDWATSSSRPDETIQLFNLALARSPQR